MSRPKVNKNQILNFPNVEFVQQWATPGSYSITIPVGINRVWLAACGAGGGGGNYDQSGPGGGGGAGCQRGWVNVDPIYRNWNLVVGQGGAAGGSLGSPGASGTSTIITTPGGTGDFLYFEGGQGSIDLYQGGRGGTVSFQWLPGANIIAVPGGWGGPGVQTDGRFTGDGGSCVLGTNGRSGQSGNIGGGGAGRDAWGHGARVGNGGNGFIMIEYGIIV
jgi:hypothetical protein